MSKYTTELRYIIESGFDIGLKNYPIFKEDYREQLNKKIIEHYYFREIGLETAELFKFMLNREMNEIMVYYNQLYQSALLEYDPLFTKDFKETFTRTQTVLSENVGESTGENKSKNIYSDTPQGLLSIENIENNLYASSASIDNSKGKTDSLSSSENNSSEEFTREIKGIDGNANELLLKFRQTLINIDMMVINDLKDLFLNLY